MIRFENDYNVSAHPRVLEAMGRHSAERNKGYLEDEHTQKAEALIKSACGAPDADVYFVVGGTQANQVMIAAALRPHQGVVSAETGHIATYEAGAIEATGHKIITVPGAAGKITAAQVKEVYDNHMANPARLQTVQPGLVYISHPTENGTVYTLDELEQIRTVCDDTGLLLMCDGARLAYGLASESDVTMADLARLCDVFYIGGTKAGALFGEAIVITNPAIQADFRYIMRRHGAVLAKGFLLGVQFAALFEGGLYEEIGRHGVTLAMELRAGLMRAGYAMRYETGTNQLFPILPDELLKKLESRFTYSFWERHDDTHSVVRLCTSWSTTREDITALIDAVQ